MFFEIRTTDVGPIIVYENDFLTLSSNDSLLQFFHEDIGRLDALEDHIKQNLQDAFSEYIEAFAVGINAPVAKMYAYVGASQQFLILKNIRFPQYIEAVRQAEQEE